MQVAGHCPACRGDLIQKPLWRLWLVAVLMLVGSTALFHYVHSLRFLGVTVALAGCYLAAWAMIGKGRWCRQCKRFPIG